MESLSIETTVKEDHLFHLPEELPVNSRIRIVIERIDNSVSGTVSGKSTKFQPRTQLGRELLALREEYIASGGKLFSEDELDAEMDDRRGGVIDE
ncbi:hypothetical protein IQ218_04555 [Synechocystis salina LEGE 06099]|uniref:hypothetical protein n=1 Tax=Synechocystis salina TaxID=945780 RepID=UPI00188120E2|nr:hypothetical protein [Synechocystis salina]MBE9202864.1 hypothetical protein [Synechocystis salina LEGE 06099]